MEKTQAFQALSKICLNNWHYIDKKVLTLNEGINFFTGHSGSGKSTVLDALQIVLYADTDGRRFFNKAAADDSNRYHPVPHAASNLKIHCRMMDYVFLCGRRNDDC